MMGPAFEAATPSIISGLFLLVIGYVVGYVINRYKQYKEDRTSLDDMMDSIDKMIKEHSIVMYAIKNMNRATIIDMCDRAIKSSYISDVQFKALCELEDSYHQLHGNSYTDEMIEKAKTIYQQQYRITD